MQMVGVVMRKKKTTVREEIEEAIEEDKLYESDSDSADELDEAEDPIKDATLLTEIIKEITVYPKELVIYFNDGSTRVYVEKVLS